MWVRKGLSLGWTARGRGESLDLHHGVLRYICFVVGDA